MENKKNILPKQKFIRYMEKFEKLDVISLVWPNCLFLTNADTAKNLKRLKELKITHVVNIYNSEQPFKKEISYYNIPDLDDDIEQTDYLYKQLEAALDFIDNALKNKGKVLVHCMAGISRSATFVIAYLMLRKNYSLIDAFKMARKNRKSVWPNIGFMELLISLEKKKFKKNTINLEEYKIWNDNYFIDYENNY